MASHLDDIIRELKTFLYEERLEFMELVPLANFVTYHFSVLPIFMFFVREGNEFPLKSDAVNSGDWSACRL